MDEKKWEIPKIEEMKFIPPPQPKKKDYVQDFPKELRDKELEARGQVWSMILSSNYEEAEQAFEKFYSDIREKEEELEKGKRFHKGGALFWWGFSLIYQESIKKVFRGYEKFALAYIEDLLDFNREYAQEAPARTTLLQKSSDMQSSLDLIQKQVDDVLSKGIIPKNPEEILCSSDKKVFQNLREPTDITFKQLQTGIQEWLKECGAKEIRVFVGGNYRNIAVLRLIKQIVRNFDFIPIMPIDFPATSEASHKDWIHDISMEVLKECSYAIFEVTFSNGHLMEIERVKDFRIKPILVYQISEHGDNPTVTSMLLTKDFTKEGYRNFDELRIKINSFLSQSVSTKTES